ncbi:MAG: hypothetical protein ABH871_04540 [Pseudomonadota bacterium]
MKKIIIISPDPEMRRMLTLAFELDGWKVKTAATIDSTSKSGKADLILFDMAEGSKAFKKDDFEKAPSKAKVVVIPPRGMVEKDIKQEAPNADLIIPRPFELMHLVRTASEMVV